MVSPCDLLAELYEIGAVTHWYYIDGPKRVGPFNDREWQELVDAGTVRPETLVWNEELPGWVPFQTLLSSGAPTPEGMPPVPAGNAPSTPYGPQLTQELEAYEKEILAEDYTLSSGDTLWEVWQILNRHFFKIVAYFFLALLIFMVASMLPFVGGVIQLIFGGVFLAGLYNIALRCYGDKPTSTNDLFIGFKERHLKDLILQALVTNGVVYGACLIIVIATVIAILAVGGGEIFKGEGRMPGLEDIDILTFAVLGLLYMVILSVAVYFSFAWLYSIPLIVEKTLPWRSALRISYHKVMQHPWRLGWVLTVVYFAIVVPPMIGLAMAGISIPLGLPDYVTACLFGGVVLSFLVIFPALFIANVALYKQMFTVKGRQLAEKPTDG